MTFTRVETILAVKKIFNMQQQSRPLSQVGRRQAVWVTSPGVDHHRRCQNSIIVVLTKQWPKMTNWQHQTWKTSSARNLLQRGCNIVAEQLQDFKMILAGPILQPGAARRFEKQKAEATDLVQATYRWQRNFADVIFTDEQMSTLFS